MNASTLPVSGPVEQIPVPRSESAAVLSMIERAARDPAVDVDKLRQLMELREKAEIRQAERDFNDGMNAAQTEMGRVRADATNPQTRSKYASYPALDRALRPVYTAKGFSLSFNTEEGGPADHVRVVCYASAFGHTRKYHIDMPSDGKGAKGGDVMTKTHAAGSAVQYGMRYLLKMIFNIAVGEDDDGNAASGPVVAITQDQADKLTDRIESVGADRKKFLAFFEIEKVIDLPAKRHGEASTMLDKFAQQKAAK